MITKTRNEAHSIITESLIEQKVNEILVNSFIKDTYQDYDGTIYILVVIKNKDLIK